MHAPMCGAAIIATVMSRPLASAFFVLLLGCAPQRAPESAAAASTRKPAADFKLQDSTGQTVRLSDYKGKVVLLDFWATWCGPCKVEEPWLKEFEAAYKDRGFSVLAVSMDEEGWEVVKPYIEKQKFNFRVLLATPEIDKLYPGMEAWPTSFLVDRQGRIADNHVGLVSKSVFINKIESLLKETN
jgi:peroxiredoxin